VRLLASVAATAWLLQAALASATEPATAPRALTLEDSEAVQNPAGIRLSRDGRLVAYVLRKQVYVVPVAGGAPRAVTAAGSSASIPTGRKTERRSISCPTGQGRSRSGVSRSTGSARRRR
jgi:hypothetical protein